MRPPLEAGVTVTERRIFLIGLSGSGKSTVGRILAERLGWEFADSDREIESVRGHAVGDIFREEGEAAFRTYEAAALRQLATREPIVVATGGGAPTNEESRRAIGSGFAIWLAASPESAAERLAANPETEERPLIGGDTLRRLKALNEERGELYRRADAAVDVDALSPEMVAGEIVNLWEEWRANPAPAGERFYRGDDGLSTIGASPRPGPGWRALADVHVAAVVRTATATYPVVVENGSLNDLGGICRDIGFKGRAFVVTDEAVGPLYGPLVAEALAAAGFETRQFALPVGEDQKNLATVSGVYDWLIGNRVERRDFVVCLGGGVVTDLGGFAAATCLRGIDFVHVPTSLLGMVDASVGGKTGVDHPRGKNMIGAFVQPRAVVIDPLVLRTLPERQLRNGWAEVIKHAFILDETLMRDLESETMDGAALMSAEIIGRSVAIKAEVVSDDEREADRRTLLNYGHTVGHAIEAVTGYTRFLHGEAVAVGMRAAGMISVELGLLSEDGFERQQRLIRACGLPETAPGLDADAVIEATLLDKKVAGGKVRWVLLERLGKAVLRDGVPDDVVRRAVAAVVAD